jgi:uncharacterized protein YydD (DUF2326 family)
MIRLVKLYSNPKVFEPISFELGVNLILGEKVDESTSTNRKTNGVGKSLSIEFINFCLLKKKDDSRVMKVPNDILPNDTQIILDVLVNGKAITIIRTKGKADNPIFIIDNENTEFRSIEDATNYLSSLLIGTSTEECPSFRQLMSLMIRDERSEFKDIIQTFDTSKNSIPPDYTSHLYLFGIDLETYKKTKAIIAQITKKKDFKSELKKKIEQKYSSVSDAFSELNALKEEVGKIGKSVDDLQSNQAFDSIQKDLVAIESEMDNIRSKQKALKYELKKIQSLPEPEKITESDIEIIYDQFKKGLGDVIAKSIDQVKLFKSKIDSFQQMLINSRKQELEIELGTVSEKLRLLEANYSEKLESINAKGRFKNIKVAMAVLTKKSDELANTRIQLESYDETDKELKQLNRDKSNLIAVLDNSVDKLKTIIEEFNRTILDIHGEIMDNEKASFRIETIEKANRKEVFHFEMRIDSDGSHSVDRAKVFIYDMALLFNSHTRERHPRLLIHDNIFDVDKDTLIQSLNYLSRVESLFYDFQYILTLNRDEIEHDEQLIHLDINTHKRAELTKQKRFLLSTSDSPYQEKSLKLISKTKIMDI